MTELAISEVLYRAADLIEERGWGRGAEAMRGENGLCVMGALFTAIEGRTVTDEESAVDALSYDRVSQCPAGQALRSYLDTRSRLFMWNDNPVRTASEVIAALRACAVIEAARETADIWPHVGADRMPEAMS